MALELKKGDFTKSVNPLNTGGNWIEGINKIVASFDKVINSSSKLLGSYTDIAQRLKGNPPVHGGMGTLQAPVQRPAVTRQVPPPPVAPPPPPPPVAAPVVEPVVDKRAKAEALFSELHSEIKPYLAVAKTVSAAQVIQWALQPENKEKILAKIMERL